LAKQAKPKEDEVKHTKPSPQSMLLRKWRETKREKKMTLREMGEARERGEGRERI
jgi:hypothetical protein